MSWAARAARRTAATGAMRPEDKRAAVLAYYGEESVPRAQAGAGEPPATEPGPVDSNPVDPDPVDPNHEMSAGFWGALGGLGVTILFGLFEAGIVYIAARAGARQGANESRRVRS